MVAYGISVACHGSLLTPRHCGSSISGGRVAGGTEAAEAETISPPAIDSIAAKIPNVVVDPRCRCMGVFLHAL